MIALVLPAYLYTHQSRKSQHGLAPAMWRLLPPSMRARWGRDTVILAGQEGRGFDLIECN